MIRQGQIMNDDGTRDFPSGQESHGGGGDGQERPAKAMPRPGRVNGRNSTKRSGGHSIHKRLHNEIISILQANRDKAAKKEKKVGARTMEIRKTDVLGFFSDLMFLGCRLESVYNLKQKHLVAVFNHLEAGGQATSTIAGKISTMRTFCGWIGKDGMVRESHHYVKDPASVKRTMVAQSDKSWDAHGVDPMKILADIRAIRNGREERVAVWVEMCWAFGLRREETVEMRPGVGDNGDVLFVIDGTKGKRARNIPIRNELQRAVLEKAKRVADKKTGYMCKRGLTVKQNVDHFKYILVKVGITEADQGVTLHGLRHKYAQAQHLLMTGVEAPIKGGDISILSKNEYRLASIKVMETLGHSRASIGASYYGSRQGVRRQKDNGVQENTQEINGYKREVGEVE